jgi:hypothetical protein
MTIACSPPPFSFSPRTAAMARLLPLNGKAVAVKKLDGRVGDV